MLNSETKWYKNDLPDEKDRQRLIKAGWIKYGFVLISLRPNWKCQECRTQETFTIWLNEDGRIWCNDCVKMETLVGVA